MAGLGRAGAESRRCGPPQCRQDGRGLAHWWTHFRRDSIQSVEADQHRKRESPRPGMLLRSRRRRRWAGSHTSGFEWHDLRNHQLEYCFCRRCDDMQGTLALGSRSESGDRPFEDLLRCRQSGPRDLSGHDHRSRDRWQAAGSQRRHRQTSLGITRRLPAGQLHDHHGAAYRER